MHVHFVLLEILSFICSFSQYILFGSYFFYEPLNHYVFLLYMTINLGVFYLFILNPAIHGRPLASCCMSRFSPVPLPSSPLSSTSVSAVGAPAGDKLRKPQNKWIKMLSQGLDSRAVFFFSWFSYFTQLTNEGVALPKERAYKYWLSYTQQQVT